MTDTTPPQEIGRPECDCGLNPAEENIHKKNCSLISYHAWYHYATSLSEASARDRARIGELEKALEKAGGQLNFFVPNIPAVADKRMEMALATIRQALSSHPRQLDWIREALERFHANVRVHPTESYTEVASSELRTLFAALKGKTA